MGSSESIKQNHNNYKESSIPISVNGLQTTAATLQQKQSSSRFLNSHSERINPDPCRHILESTNESHCTIPNDTGTTSAVHSNVTDMVVQKKVSFHSSFIKEQTHDESNDAGTATVPGPYPEHEKSFPCQNKINRRRPTAAIIPPTTNKSIFTKAKKPNLSIQIDSFCHDDDWTQVSSSSSDDEAPHRFHRTKHKGALSVHHRHRHSNNNDSYHFTQSGTIWMKQFHHPIKKTGIMSPETTLTPSPNSSQSSPKQPNTAIPMQHRLVKLNKLGQGCSGTVHRALDLNTLTLVAVKSISVENSHTRKHLLHELRTLTTQHDDTSSPSPHLISFLDAYANVRDGTVNIVMEYMDGKSLQDFVDRRNNGGDGGCRDEELLAHLARQCLRGLAALHHDKHQMHRDLKPSNILLSRDGRRVKIADFGICRPLTHDDGAAAAEEEPKALAETFVGTLTYMSPERLRGEGYSYPADIWSLGLSLLTVARGALPVNGACYWSVVACVRDEGPPSLAPEEEWWSREFRDFVGSCLRKDPAERPGCEELLRHPFVAGGGEEEGDDEGWRFERDYGVEFGGREGDGVMGPREDFHNVLEAVRQHVRQLTAENIFMERDEFTGVLKLRVCHDEFDKDREPQIHLKRTDSYACNGDNGAEKEMLHVLLLSARGSDLKRLGDQLGLSSCGDDVGCKSNVVYECCHEFIYGR